MYRSKIQISDFLVTNFDQESILRMNEDYSITQTYKFVPNAKIENFQAGCQNDKPVAEQNKFKIN